MSFHFRQRAKNRVLSFKYAFEGLGAALKEEPNLTFHALFALLVISAGFYFQISSSDWVLIIIMIGLVLALELTNTAIEAIVDSFTPEQHPRAKYAKDIAAAAVLIISLTAVIVGLMVFIPYL